ncbi:MAG: ribosome maturation factor RimM [Burkholderiaceae bacterium]
MDAASPVPASPPADLVEVGRIGGAHGVRGAIKVIPHGRASDSALRTCRQWWLTDLPPVARERLGVAARQWPASVESARVQVDLIVAQLRGVSDRDLAIALNGARVWISRSAFPAAASDEYYWVDLIGCDVVDPSDRMLGRVAAVEEYGAGPLLKVHGADGVDRLIPFVDAVIGSVDVPGRRIVADWGLDY